MGGKGRGEDVGRGKAEAGRGRQTRVRKEGKAVVHPSRALRQLSREEFKQPAVDQLCMQAYRLVGKCKPVIRSTKLVLDVFCPPFRSCVS